MLVVDLCVFVPFRREHSKVPLIVRQCVEEIERRGMEEVGIYRVSGVATDIQALKAAFDASEYCSTSCRDDLNKIIKIYYIIYLISYTLLIWLKMRMFCDSTDNKDVSVMMSEMDVNAIAGTLKLYFRELPEPLFTDELYANFSEGIG